MEAVPSTGSLLSGRSSETRFRVIAPALLVASVTYALSAIAFLPHRLSLVEVVSVFCAGAAPGLVVTLLLWFARPQAYARPVRRALVAVTVVGAAAVATLPLLFLRG